MTSDSPSRCRSTCPAASSESDALIVDVLGALGDSGLDPHALVVEVTETAIMHDAESAVRQLAKLKDIGARVAVDDFGTGYCTLAYLHQFPVDTLKIDKSFVDQMIVGNEGVALVRATVQMANALGLKTVAEGIEEVEQLDLLRVEGCESGQGFFYARPMDAGAAEQFMVSHPVVGATMGTGERAARTASSSL